MPTDPLAETLAREEIADGPAARPVVGERYELLGLLGSGGMGNVYKARDLELDEVVALKVLKPEHVGTPGALDRFRREVKLARRVTHPNVARVFDIGDRGDEKILTMELIDGESLAGVLQRSGALSVGRVLEIAKAVCAGVAAAHSAGVVHRDLKPDNVLLSTTGRIVVSDFGIARAAAANAAERTAGGIVGTPLYMAPEQVEGHADIDARADIYAFGVMLYEMLTGEPAWRGDSVIAIAAARLVQPPPDARAAKPDVDPALASIALRAMARDRGARQASMEAILSELSSIAVPSARTSTSSTTALPPSRGRPASEKRVAVLPFRNLGPEEHAYVADALTEDLIDNLSMAKGVHVQSRGVVMRYRGKDTDPREVGRELGVQVVVEGAIRRAPGTFRIDARVVSVSEGFQLWARRFSGTDADPLRLNDEVARAVASALTVEIDPPARDEGDAEAVDLYLKARAVYHRFYTGNAAEAAALFARALARSPNDPRLLAGAVMSRSRMPLARSDDYAALRADAERAVSLAPSLPDSYIALGVVLAHNGREAEAIEPLKRALRLMPNCAEAHDALGRILVEADDARGARHLEAALALEPEFEFARVALARYLALRGDSDAGIALQGPGGWGTFHARQALWRRDAETAASLLKSMPERFEIDRPIFNVVRAYLEVTIHKRPPSFDPFPAGAARARVRAFAAQARAEMAAALDDRSGALDALEECASIGVFDLAWIDRCPLFADFRAEPRFVRARETVKERAERIIEAYDRRPPPTG